MADNNFDAVLQEIAESMRSEDVCSIARGVMGFKEAVVENMKADYRTVAEQNRNVFVKWKGMTGGGRAELRQVFEQARAKGIPVHNDIFQLLADAATEVKPIDDKSLRTLARKLPDHGFDGFAVEFLDLEPATVEQIGGNNQRNVADKNYQLLSSWKNKNRGSNSADHLRAILERAASDESAINVPDGVYDILKSAR